MLRKLSDLPQQLQEREINALPPIMLVTDLLRCLREQVETPHLSIFFEQGVAQRRGTCRLLFHLAPSQAAAEAVDLQIPPHLQELRRHYDAGPAAVAALVADAEQALVVALPLRQPPDEERIATLIKALNVPTKQRLMADLEREKQKARDVLFKIFPTSVVQQLEDGANAIYDFYPSTSILFSDMVGFTNMSKNMDARELVTFIDDVFQRIDRLCMQHGVEKIKTIGDSYMAAAGVPNNCSDHAERIANLAIDIQELHRELFSGDGSGHQLDARIGIHSGPVVAGVIGLNKFSFDLWGDTVNVASRMESTGIPGEIQISVTTKELLPANFITHIRGHVAMKGHSSIETFLLRGR
ncbi:MAG: adenylate/guanylate cyclase domain-containing protein [Cyanobacteriota bacterium]|nr:adenylate/guanylate cyclase domain-containing protein [Cyanobacteriota bacterium]